MEIKLNLNGKDICQDISPDMLLIDFLRMNGCLSVKRGCDTSNCGLCTVFMDDKPILSCSILALRVAGHKIVTLEGLQEEVSEFATFIAMALFKENSDPSDDEILAYLSGNLCRCSGYEGQLRGIKAYLAFKKQKGE